MESAYAQDDCATIGQTALGPLPVLLAYYKNGLTVQNLENKTDKFLFRAIEKSLLINSAHYY